MIYNLLISNKREWNNCFIKGRTIRKVMGGGGGKTKKKFMQGKLPRKKIRAKKKVKKKNSCRRKVQVRLLWLDVIYLLILRFYCGLR